MHFTGIQLECDAFFNLKSTFTHIESEIVYQEVVRIAITVYYISGIVAQKKQLTSSQNNIQKLYYSLEVSGMFKIPENANSGSELSPGLT